METIDVKRLADEQGQKDIDVIDVRMPTEFREIHAECARNVPLDSLDPNAVMGAQRISRSAAVCDLPQRQSLGASL